jgi:hypothetical protein
MEYNNVIQKGLYIIKIIIIELIINHNRLQSLNCIRRRSCYIYEGIGKVSYDMSCCYQIKVLISLSSIQLVKLEKTIKEARIGQ